MPLPFDLDAIDTSDIDQVFMIHGRIDATLATAGDNYDLGTRSTALMAEAQLSAAIQ